MTAPSSTAQRQVQIKRETHQIQSFNQDLGNGIAMRFVLIPRRDIYDGFPQMTNWGKEKTKNHNMK